MVNGKSNSDSPASDTAASRMSTRSSQSPSVRKSNRLGGRSPPTPNPNFKKISENCTPLRKSVKDIKSQSPVESKGMLEKGSHSSIKRLDARRYRDMFRPLKKIANSESETDRKRILEFSGASGDSDHDNGEDGKHRHSDVEECMGEGCTEAEVDDAVGSVSVVNDKTCTDKPCELEDGDNSLPSRSPRKETMENSDKTEEVSATGDVIEKCPNGETLSAPDKLSHDDNGLGCSPKAVTSRDSTIANEGDLTCSMDAHSALSSCKIDILSEECAICFRKRSLDRDSPQQVLCCCLSNIVNDVDGSKDRGQCGTGIAEFDDEHNQLVTQSNSSFDICGSVCDACQLGGKLLHCRGKGCKRSYHPSCSLNPEKDLYLPNWYCSECTKKKFAFGVHSVSQGIESVFDVRVVELSTEGILKQKQCFVKFKGLAHIHNRWLPEKELLHDVPELNVQVGKQNEDTKWNPIWAMPHRLLSRRLVIVDSVDEGVSLDPKTKHEWLVKWCGLDYDQATWEIEDISCFKTPEAQQLMKEYETRHNKVYSAPFPVNNEIQERRKGSHVKLGRQLVGGTDGYYQNFINKLREWHHKGQNAILLDEQDRLMKMIYLVSSLMASVSRPFLIIAPHNSLYSWEAEFMRLSSSINIVIYGGNADSRDIIRSLEFFEGGQLMVQVILSSADVIAKDSEELKGIEWEAVIVDDCQQSCIVAHSGAIMNLATGWRLLLINSQLEDNISEYINILSLLEPGCRNLNEEINVLKNKLSSFIVCARFIEYWVPVEMSNLQLEQYCYSILSKSSVLQSVSKSDPVGSLREILISLRKCCDHPYIVDMQLQSSLAYGLPYDAVMDLGIKASGKLYLLDKLLSELKKHGLKVLILFQPAGGSGRDSTGNILDDFLRFRFGSDSYEHVYSGLVPSKKQTACNQFNSVKERSFFLLETRACSPTIKLLLVDAVIIFDSDWNPLNDLRALQKITLDSKIEQIKVFRLYCPGTVEEKVLILAKNDVVLDSNLQITNPSTSHMLLMWGSSYLFSRLHKFHQNNVSDSKDNIVFESLLSIDVTQEIVSLFRNQKLFLSSKNISVAQQNGGCYYKNIPVIGEQRNLADDGVPPHVFWSNLLEGLKPQWKYLSGSSQRNRKRVQYNEELSSDMQSDEATKRRKKTENTKIDSSPLQAESRLETSIINSQYTDPNRHKDGGNLSVVTNGTVITELDDIENLHNEQRGLFELLKPTMLQLCEALLLKDDGKRSVEQFLKYLIKNYRVTKDPETRLQSFLLSVCWTAVEGLKRNIDYKKSVAVVREKLGFTCTESEAKDIHSKLKPIYSCWGITKQHSFGDLLPGNAEKDYEKYMKKVEKGCDKQMEKLKIKHDEELKEFEKSWEDKRMKLEQWYKLESSIIRYTLANSSVRTDKLRALDNDYARKKEDLERKVLICLKELEARQQVEREEEQKKIAGFMERVKSLRVGHDSDAKIGVNFNETDPVRPGKESNESMCYNGNLIETSRDPGAVRDSIASEKLENTDKQRAICDNDDFSIALENISVSNGAGIITYRPEQSCVSTGLVENDTNPVIAVVDDSSTSLPSNQKSIALENISVSNGAGIITCPPEQSCVSSELAEKDTNPVNAVVDDSLTSLPSNQINNGLTMGSLTEQLIPNTSQELEAGSHMGLEEQVSNATMISNSSFVQESLPNVASNIVRTGELNNSTECSLDECNRVASNGRLDNQLNENHASIGGTTAPMQHDHSSSSSSGLAFSPRHRQLTVDESVNANHVPIVASAHASLPIRLQTPFTSISRVSTSLPDPLQLELDRLQNEMAKIMNHHAGTKLQLKSECDKEIEELVAQVRKKYEKKIDEAEASFKIKKDELEMCQHKVLMNKILAEAFRSKCTEYKAAAKGPQLGIPPSSSSVESPRPVALTRPVAGPLCTAPPAQGVGPIASSITQSRMACINPRVAPLAGVQLQVRPETHAPAASIQALSSSTAIAPSSVPMRPPQNNPTSTCALHLPSQSPQLRTSAQSNPHSRSPQEGSLGRQTLLNFSIELLRNITRQNDSILRLYSSNVPSVSGNPPSSESWEISQSAGATNTQPFSSSLPTGDVVCLSDDE